MSLALDRRLPEELLDYIISSEPRETLLNLCRTSKTLNRVATPHLYRTITLRETDHLPALTHLIFTSSIHSALVKSFIISNTWAEYEERYTEWSWPILEDQELQTTLKSKCAEYASSKDEAVTLYEKIESGANEDAIMAFLIASLPALERLNINFGICNGHQDFVALWPMIINKIRSYTAPNLNEHEQHKCAIARSPLSTPLDVMSTGSETRDPNNPVHLAMMMHFPNLRCLYAWRVGDAENVPDPTANPFAQLAPRSCPVTYIELRASKLHKENLKYVMAATIPGSLKTFNYEIGCTWAWCTIDHACIMASLQAHYGTLEALGLSHEDHYPFQHSPEFDWQPPCSFSPFTALKRLKVAPVYIWGHPGFIEIANFTNPAAKEMLWKALPENLEELWIVRAHHQELRGYDATVRFVPECLLPALRLVVQNKGQAFPKLRHLYIELPLMIWEDEWFDTLASLCESAASSGIHCTVILFDMLDRWSKLAVEQPWGWYQDIEWEAVRYSVNRETAKVWVVAAEHQDLAQVLRDLKVMYKEVLKRFNEARLEIRAMGMLCTNCQLDPAYDASRRVNMAELRRIVEERLRTKNCWSGRPRS